MSLIVNYGQWLWTTTRRTATRSLKLNTKWEIERKKSAIIRTCVIHLVNENQIVRSHRSSLISIIGICPIFASFVPLYLLSRFASLFFFCCEKSLDHQVENQWNLTQNHEIRRKSHECTYSGCNEKRAWCAYYSLKTNRIIICARPSPLSLCNRSIFHENINSTRQLYLSLAFELIRHGVCYILSFFHVSRSLSRTFSFSLWLCRCNGATAAFTRVSLSILPNVCALFVSYYKEHKVISFVMENRFNSRKNENTLAVLPPYHSWCM